MRVADVFESLWGLEPIFVMMIFVRGSEGRECGEKQEWFHRMECSDFEDVFGGSLNDVGWRVQIE